MTETERAIERALQNIGRPATPGEIVVMVRAVDPSIRYMTVANEISAMARRGNSLRERGPHNRWLYRPKGGKP